MEQKILNKNMIEKLEGFFYEIRYNYTYQKEKEESGFSGFCKEPIEKELFIKELKERGYKDIKILSLIFTKGNKISLKMDVSPIFDNEEDVLRYIERTNKITLSNRKFNREQKIREEKENLIISEKEKYLNLFLENFDNKMQKGRVKKVLYRRLNYSKFGILNRFKFCEKVKESYLKTAYEKEIYYNKNCELIEKMVHRIYLTKDTFHNVTKIEYDYINFLSELNQKPKGLNTIYTSNK